MKPIVSATATPLASIFGSGFLVIVPILNGAVGPYSFFAMAAVCAVAYGVGSVIRHNILHAEPLLARGEAPRSATDLEGAADIALVVAYSISVCLYLNIMAAFFLRGLGDTFDTIHNQHLLSAGVVLAIGTVGYTRGLSVLESLESVGLWVTMVIIVGLCVGFGAFDLGAFRSTAGLQMPVVPKRSAWEILTIVGGTLIVVQGFETSRYLGAQYDAETRVRSCRMSQLVSTGVYLGFIALATPLMHFLGNTVRDNDLIMLAGKASMLLPLPLVLAAVLSQFSAAVADTLGGGGNLVEASEGHVDSSHAYLIICGGAVLLAFAPTLTILTLASKAFAFYYMLQCFVAMAVADSGRRRVVFGLLAAVLAFIAIFTVSAG